MDTSLRLDVDGRGVVSAAVGLDREALAQVPDLAHQLRVDDLRRAGWQVAGPRRAADGLTWVRATRRVATPQEADAALAQINGPLGPLRGVRVTQTRTPFRTRTRLAGTVDLRPGLAALGDPALAQHLGLSGLDGAALRRRFGVDLDRALQVRVEAALPGATRAWRVRPGDPPRRLVVATASWNARNLALAGAGSAALVAAVAVGLGARRRPRPAP